MVDHLVKTFFPDFKIYTRDFVATVDREGQNCSKPITEQKIYFLNIFYVIFLFFAYLSNAGAS